MTRSRPRGEPPRHRRPIRVPAFVFILLGPAWVVGGLLSGCPKDGPVCSEGFSRCGLGCADLASDALNCGACGFTCSTGELCQNGGCQCQSGATLCGDSCVSVASDPRNCGGCAGVDGGERCQAEQVCELGHCRAGCINPGSTQCGQSCVDLRSNVNNCGQCGRRCRNAQSCHQGICTYDVIAACFNTGQVVGIQGDTHLQGDRARVGSAPQSLATLSDVLLLADGLDRRLRQARLSDFSPLAGESSLGASPNHIWIEDPLVYVVNSLGNTLQILQRQASPDGGLFPSGLQLTTIGEVNLGPVSSPQAMVKLGEDLYIPLWGGDGQVARVDVANPRAPFVAKVFDLRDLDLKSFDGGRSYARPGAIALAWGRLYVALNNLDIGYSPSGPGMLARIDPASESVTAVDLGADVCLNAYWLAATERALYVSCGGKTIYGPGYEPLSVEKSGVVVLNDREERTATWTVSCAPGTTGCLPPSVGRFAVFNHQLFLADQAGGRVFVLESVDDRLVERRGHNPVDGGPPIPACSRDGGVSLVIDVIAVP